MRQPAIFFGHGSPMNALGGPYADAWRALGTAVGAVQSLPPGVYIAMNGRIWDPAKVRKNVAANRFEAV